jgi:apolipoprotein N-acyltransferase
MLPLTGGWYVLAAACIGCGSLAPYVIHRALAARLPLALVPLLFPLAATALEFLGNRVQPFGSFGAVAYTQMGVPALLQVAAVAGLPGIAALVCLPAAVVHWAVDLKPPAALRRTWLALALLAEVAGTGVGAARLALSPPDAATVPVAIVSSPLHRPLSALLAPAYATGDPATVAWDAALAQGERVTADLFARTRDAAAAGARIVLWPETAVLVAAARESAVLEQALALTRQTGIYLAMPLGVVRHRARPWPAGDGAIDNKILLLAPSGEVIAEHRKSIAVPGPEAALLVPGSATVPSVQTAYGRIALAICFDLDFPSLLRQAAGADLLLAPAEDWPGITPYHSDMARLRAIEGGYAVVRAARYGRSLAADAYGRLRAAAVQDATPAGERTPLLARVPVRGVPTAYGRLGDAFGWLAVLGYGALVLLALLRWRCRDEAILSVKRPSRAEVSRDPPS